MNCLGCGLLENPNFKCPEDCEYKEKESKEVDWRYKSETKHISGAVEENR